MSRKKDVKNNCRVRENHYSCVDVSDSLDHHGNILVQVAAVEFHQVHENMEKVGGKTYIHPQEDEAC